MQNIHIILNNIPGELARFGKLLGENDIGLEGGGVFTVNHQSHAHFLVENGERARDILINNGFEVVAVTTPLIRRLRQEKPGELGAIARALADKSVNIITQYSDHHNRLILITDNDTLAEQATTDWTA
ncbi:amino acid-binding protein [Gynuella sunshinyii]|uniref:ACT domain-containing protein n=1 Tax=Gynuella sunshinyii YC6258 TaxID=1445510 RepID=A0A0C5VJ24_9GAMM|nr:amino acid-binding protein [Gynuella sunshinyii]AJQ93393.1 ACT domain-containing protein [Gynuella sunshinyii YC6258]